MEIPKDYIKCINFDVRTKEHSNNYMYQLTYLLKDYTAPYISTGNYTIGFTLIKPLNKHILNLLLKVDGIEYYDEIEYFPYNRDEEFDDLIKYSFNGECYGINYLKFLMRFMPDKPIIGKLSSIKLTANIPNEILEIDNLLQQSKIESHLNDNLTDCFTNKFLEKITRDYDFHYMYETKIIKNTITIYLIRLLQYQDKSKIDRIKNGSSKYIQDIEIINKESK